MERPEKLTVTPLGALLRGLLAGSAGTGLMTAYQTLVQAGESEGDEQPASEAERWQRRPHRHAWPDESSKASSSSKCPPTASRY
jgi:hypothetical protein